MAVLCGVGWDFLYECSPLGTGSVKVAFSAAGAAACAVIVGVLSCDSFLKRF